MRFRLPLLIAPPLRSAVVQRSYRFCRSYVGIIWVFWNLCYRRVSDCVAIVNWLRIVPFKNLIILYAITILTAHARYVRGSTPLSLRRWPCFERRNVSAPAFGPRKGAAHCECRPQLRQGVECPPGLAPCETSKASFHEGCIFF